MEIVRRIAGALLIIGAGALLFIGGDPFEHLGSKAIPVTGTPPVTDTSSQVSQVLNDAETNNSTSYGAPQQAVAAEWAVPDLTAIVARQQNTLAQIESSAVNQAAAADERTARSEDRMFVFMALLAVGLGLALLTSRRPKTPPSPAWSVPLQPRPAAPAPAPTPPR